MLYMPLPEAGDELSAIRAWDLVSGHPRRGELDRRDNGAIIDELKPKINCYGSVFPFLAPRFCPWRFGGGLMGAGLAPWWRRSKVKDALMKVACGPRIGRPRRR